MRAIIILIALLVSSCSGHLVVWNMMDIIGLAITAIALGVALILILIAFVKSKISA